MTVIRNFTTNTITITNDGNHDKRESLLVNALWSMESIDTYMIGEPYTLGNWSEGVTLHSAYSGMCYTLDIGALSALPVGGSLVLEARTPDEADREYLAIEYGEEVTA